MDTCYFGTDIDNRESLITYSKTVEEIRQSVGADSLEYLSIDSLKEITKDCKISNLCMGCFTSEYPVEVPTDIKKNSFEEIKF